MARGTLIILVGPKGAGKSFIGELVHERLGVPFLLVEPLFVRLRDGRDPTDPSYAAEGYARLEQVIGERLTRGPRLMFETTGTSPLFAPLLRRLQRQHDVRLVRVHAPQDLCRARIRARDPSAQVPVTDQQIDEINRLAVAVQRPFDLEIDTGAAGEEEIVATMRSLVAPG